MNVGVLRVAGPVHCRRRQRASRIGAAD